MLFVSILIRATTTQSTVEWKGSAVKFGSGILDVELPFDDALGRVPLSQPVLGLPSENLHIRETRLQTAAGQQTELYLRQVQPLAAWMQPRYLGGTEDWGSG